MTGVLYSRLPSAKNTDVIHLWVGNSSSGGWKTACSENAELHTEEDKQQNSVLISDGDGEQTVLRVTQKESFKQANSGYCTECLQEHPKIKDSWDF